MDQSVTFRKSFTSSSPSKATITRCDLSPQIFSNDITLRYPFIETTMTQNLKLVKQ